MGWEVDSYDIADCPCGEGKIVLERHSPDNGWSRPYDTTELACSKCAILWEVDTFGNHLTEKSSRAASRQADAEASAAAGKITDYLNSILPHLVMPTFKTMGAEFEYLHAQGLYRGTVGQYRYARRSDEMMEIAEVRADSAIIPHLVGTVGDHEMYDALVAAAQATKKVAADKSKAVRRIPIPKKF